MVYIPNGFSQDFKDGAASRQPEVDALKDEVRVLNGCLKQRDEIDAKKVSEIVAPKKRVEELEGFAQWLNSECPHATMTNDLSHDFAENLRDRLDIILNPNNH